MADQDLASLEREAEQFLQEWSGGVDQKYWSSPLKLVRRLLEALTEQQAKTIAAEHHKALSLLGKSSWQEVVEDKLRVELAETQVRAETAEASLLAIRGYVQQLEAERDQARVVTMGDGNTSRTASDVPAGSGEPTTPDQGINDECVLILRALVVDCTCDFKDCEHHNAARALLRRIDGEPQ